MAAGQPGQTSRHAGPFCATLRTGAFRTRDDIDALKVSTKYPDLVKSPLLEQFDVGYLIAPDREVRSAIVEAIGNALGRGQINPQDGFGAQEVDALAAVAGGLRTREITLELLHCWGRLNFASGLSTALSLIADDPHDPIAIQFLRQRRKRTLADDQTLQRYWFAHWMAKHGYPDGEGNRQEIEAGLANICSAIEQGRRTAILHSKDWFGGMVSSTPDGPTLKTTYTRLKKSELTRLVQNRLIPTTALPPLTIKAFRTDEQDVPPG